MKSGSTTCVYDAVANRTQKTSTIPGFPGGLTNYNANDQLATDTYDNNGNTTASNGLGYVYDFENHVIQAGAGITMTYDGDGNRVSKTVAGVTTKYLVDTQNPTGYAQVVYETWSGSTAANRELSHTFVYGLERISQLRSYLANNQSQTQTSYYVYDGHGSVRALTNPTGAVTDTYDYDAFGNLLHCTATGIPPGGTTVTATPNEFLFAGEQFDSDLNLYYNRARYLNVSSGRFWSMDTAEPSLFDPPSLHRYLYANGDSVNRSDPSGKQTTMAEEFAAVALVMALATLTTIIAQSALQRVKAEVGMRLNHYTQWVFLPLIMAGGINSPFGDNYFTPDFYLSGAEAKSRLALKIRPQVFINLTVYEYGDALHGPSIVEPANGELGGGREYSTARVVPFWTRWPVLFPLEEEINSILKPPFNGGGAI